MIYLVQLKYKSAQRNRCQSQKLAVLVLSSGGDMRSGKAGDGFTGKAVHVCPQDFSNSRSIISSQ